MGAPFDLPLDHPFGELATLQHAKPRDAVSIGLARLLEQFKPADRVRALVGVPLAVVSDIEQTIYDLLTKRLLDGEGEQLDVLGEHVFDVARDGRTDAAYRVAIKAWIRARRSSGTIPQLYEVVEALSPYAAVIIDNLAQDPAGLEVRFTSPPIPPEPATADDITTEWLTALLAEAKAGGVKVWLHWWPDASEALFTFGNLDGDSNAATGFANDDEDQGGALVGEVAF